MLSKLGFLLFLLFSLPCFFCYLGVFLIVVVNVMFAVFHSTHLPLCFFFLMWCDFFIFLLFFPLYGALMSPLVGTCVHNFFMVYSSSHSIRMGQFTNRVLIWLHPTRRQYEGQTSTKGGWRDKHSPQVKDILFIIVIYVKQYL